MNYKKMQHRVTTALNGLDNVSVKGYHNIVNMACVMQVLSETLQEISQAIKEDECRQLKTSVDLECEE